MISIPLLVAAYVCMGLLTGFTFMVVMYKTHTGRNKIDDEEGLMVFAAGIAAIWPIPFILIGPVLLIIYIFNKMNQFAKSIANNSR